MQDLSIMNLSKRNKNIILLIIDVSIIILSYFIAIILNNNIDNIYNKQKFILDLLSNKIKKLEKIEKELKEI